MLKLLHCWILPSGFVMTRPGHASKNTAGQLCSPHRNLVFGVFFCDHTASVPIGMPLSAYARSEPMSDMLNTILFNPYMVLKDLELWQIIATYGKTMQHMSSTFVLP